MLRIIKRFAINLFTVGASIAGLLLWLYMNQHMTPATLEDASATGIMTGMVIGPLFLIACGSLVVFLTNLAELPQNIKKEKIVQMLKREHGLTTFEELQYNVPMFCVDKNNKEKYIIIKRDRTTNSVKIIELHEKATDDEKQTVINALITSKKDDSINNHSHNNDYDTVNFLGTFKNDSTKTSKTKKHYETKQVNF